MRKLTLLLSLIMAFAAAAAVKVDMPKSSLTQELRRFTIPDSLYCKYFEKEYFNPPRVKVLKNGIKVLLDVDAIGLTAMLGQVDESERPHYVVLEKPDGRRYIGTANVYDNGEEYIPVEGYLDGDYGYFRWWSNLEPYTPPKKVDQRWMIASSWFTGKGFEVWNMFNQPEIYTFVDLRPGTVRNEIETIARELLPQLPLDPIFIKKGRKTREMRQTTGGYILKSNGFIFGPLTYSYNPSTGRLKMSAQRKVTSSKHKVDWWTDNKGRGTESPEWAAYCQNDLSINPRAVELREYNEAIGKDDSIMAFFGEHEVEAVSIASDNKSWMMVRRVTPPGRKHYRRDYSLWLAHPGVFYVDYAMHNAIVEGINDWVFQYFLKFDEKVRKARQRERVLTGREQELINNWYCAAGAVVGARKAPNARLGSYELDNAMGQEAYRMGAPEPVGIDHVFGAIDDDLLRRMTACPLTDSEILNVDVENNALDVNLTLSRGGKTWIEPMRINIEDRTHDQGIDVKIPTSLFINLPTEPGPHAIVVSDVVDRLKASAEQFKQSVKSVKPAPVLSAAVKDFLKTAASQKFNGRNFSDIQAYADELASLSYTTERYATLCSELAEGNNRITSLTKKLPAVAKVWNTYYKTVAKPFTIEDAGSIVAENERLSAVKAEQDKLAGYIQSVQERGEEESLKDFTEEQMLAKIRPQAMKADNAPVKPVE